MPASRIRSTLTRPAVAVAALAIVALQLTATLGGRAAQGAPPGTDLFAGREWGDVSDGVQLRLTLAWAAEERAARDGLLLLPVQIRHTLATPVTVDQLQLLYDFEYQIDGTWHVFEPVPPPAPTAGARATVPAGLSIPAGTPMQFSLVLPINSTARSLQLRVVMPAGIGRTLDLKPGPHTIRVRPSQTAFSSAVRTSPISNAVSVSTPAVSRTTAAPTPASPTTLQALRFPDGPADGRRLVEQVMQRPPLMVLFGSPSLATQETQEIVGPAAFYELPLPRRLGAPDPPLPPRISWYDYLVTHGGRGVARVAVAVDQKGASRVHAISVASSAEPIARALDALGRMERIRNASYETRLVRVNGLAGQPERWVVWLHAENGASDLLYQPRPSDLRVTAHLEFDRLYTVADFFKAVRQLPVQPKHDEAWARQTAAACATQTGVTGGGGGALRLADGTVEIGLNTTQDAIVWYVHFEEQEGRAIVSHSGARFTVDESTGTCGRVLS